ncbi:hypothetical protein [Glycomyces rhizosphaerae]|uniref:ADP-ribosyltransferase n=1 Tax=Glycomyces rhizosphaerae TaxID=2054422 RepID=A0ABV7PVJ9_9ACTN
MAKRKRSDSDGDAPGGQIVSGVLRSGRTFRQTDGLRGADRTPDHTPDGTPGDSGWKHPDNPDIALSREDNAAVDKFLDDARDAEKRTTPSITNAIDENGGKPLGLEYRLKTDDSTKLKVANMLDENPNLGVDGALKKVNDSVRYTAEFDEKRYTDGVKNVHESLKNDGFVPDGERGRFNWDKGPGYKGINSTWTDPKTGTQFEVQYHTPGSFAAKQETHDLYDNMKLVEYEGPEWQRLAAKQGETFGAVKLPDGVESLRWMDGKR